jgi:hypothetical protein
MLLGLVNQVFWRATVSWACKLPANVSLCGGGSGGRLRGELFNTHDEAI